MRIERLEIYSYPVPFKVVFRHASASRKQAENIIVAAYSDCGLVGYGEGCPRSYVTGETLASCQDFITSNSNDIINEIKDIECLRRWIEFKRLEIDHNPAAFCAVELALLDLMGKVMACPMEDVLGVPRLEGTYQYSAVLGNSPYLAYWWQFQRYWGQGFRDFKVKVSGDIRRDRKKTGVFTRKDDPALRVRLDANNLWVSGNECIDHINRLSYDFFAIEEPLEKDNLDGFRRVGEECGAKIILDESLIRAEQLVRLENPERWILNLRVSKMGGIIRSIEVAGKAAKLGIDIIVGAQVGETSILTRAGMSLATISRKHLIASEGAFGTHLLSEDLTTPCLMFGAGGKIFADQIQISTTPGLGININDKALTSIT